MHLSRSGENEKLVFRVDGTRHEHKELMDRLRQTAGLNHLETTPGVDRD
jgi:hypothetical protein